MSEKCPCCSGEQYSLCCQPFLNGQQTPQRAEQLMRSRYSAYVKQNAAWLVETWHPSQRVAGLETLLAKKLRIKTHKLLLIVVIITSATLAIIFSFILLNDAFQFSTMINIDTFS